MHEQRLSIQNLVNSFDGNISVNVASNLSQNGNNNTRGGFNNRGVEEEVDLAQENFTVSCVVNQVNLSLLIILDQLILFILWLPIQKTRNSYLLLFLNLHFCHQLP